MNIDINRIETLIARMLSGEASSNEISELDSWASTSPANKKIIDDSKKAWLSSRLPFTKSEIQDDHLRIKTKIKAQKKQVRRKKNITFFYRAAAVIAIPVLLAIGWFSGTEFDTNQTYSLCEVSAPKGQVAECVLTDGTKVWLNAGSTIQYNPTLSGMNRIVKLSGEAYFKVTKNRHKPFIVKTPNIQVKVLGTSFNVKAYPGEDETETTLEEGRIELTLSDYPNQNPVELKPGEHAVYNPSQHKFKVEKTDTYLLTAWRDGKYIFKDADLNTLIQQLEKLYDVRIYLKHEEMGSIRFRGTFEYKQNILDALETIERTTSLKYSMNGRNIWFDKK